MLTKRNLFLFFVVPLFLLLIYFSRAVITPFLLAFFLAYAINPVVEFLQQKGARRDLAILTVYLVLFLSAGLLFRIIIPRLATDLTQVIKKIPLVIGEFELVGDWLNHFLNRWKIIPEFKFVIGELGGRVEILLRRSLMDLADGVVRLCSQSFYLFLVPLLSYYFNRDYPRIKLKIYQWLAKFFGTHWTNTFLEMDAVFRVYIRGQILVTLIVGAMIALGLSLLGSEVAIFLGLFAAIFNLIPYFGPFIGAIPALVFALLRSPWHAVYVIILFTTVNQIEVMWLAPRIIGGSLGIHPAFVVYLVLIGGKIFGLWGMIFAVPLGSLLLIFLKSVYEICFGLVNN